MATKRAVKKSAKKPKSKKASPKATKRTTKKKATRGKRRNSTPKGKCFVMMPFADPFDIYFNKIYKDAIEKAGMEPIRADDLFRPSVIVSDIWNMVQKADVLFAELTTKNANVFYELGLAHAIGKPVILVSETMSDVPFDLQQLRVLLYNKDDPSWGEKLASNITAAIQETLDAPIEAVPSTFRKLVESQAPKQDKTQSRLEMLERQVFRMRRNLERPQHRRLPVTDAERELEAVNNVEGFDKWVLRWDRRGIQESVLKIIASSSSNVPEGEAERIGEVLKKAEIP
ncbi:MAG: hypothetical protein IID36_09945 [Planctomycetes bacterium]|nr:hypothetical protein [Planctomycetota bacterium]